MAKDFCFGTEQKKSKGFVFWKRDSEMAKGLCFGADLIISIEVVLQSSLKEIASARFSSLFMYPCLRCPQ